MNLTLRDLEALEKQLNGMGERFMGNAVLRAEDLQAIAIGVHFILKSEIERRRATSEPWDDEAVERAAIQEEPGRLLTIWDRLRKPEVGRE